jgi:signal transduction histidine kinase
MTDLPDSSDRSLRETLVGRLGSDALAFGLLRSLTMIGGVAALFMVPLRPEHRIHLAPLLVGFIAYKAGLLAILAGWAERAREIFLATLAADLGLVFLLVWFTGGGESHFYLLFYLLVALNAYYFGPGIGIQAALLAAGLLALANWLVAPPTPWVHIGSRAAVLGLLGLALGHVAARERAARARAEQLNREMEAAMGRLVRAEQLAAVGRLSAKMAHEVRNPLGAITLNVDMLGDIVRECPGPDMVEAQQMLHGIRNEVQALATLTEEYLVAARLPRPRLDKDSLNDVITELVGFLRPVAERQGVQIVLELDAGLPPVAFNRTMLKHAVQNLVKNSLEALNDGGRISVSTAGDDRAAMIRVADDGPGIPPDAADRLFEPFFTTKPRGTGLGLSIVRQVAREHGGEVTWTSRPGAGASFTIRLPLEEARHG